VAVLLGLVAVPVAGVDASVSRAAAGAAPTLAIDGAAAAGRAAVRIDRPAVTTCELIAGAVARRHPGSTQQLVVRTDGWADTTAVVQIATLRNEAAPGGGWTCGPEMVGRIGRAGFRPLADRRSSDGTAPAGVFPLGTMTAWDGQRFSFFGNAPDPGVTAGTYRAVRAGDCFGATPNTPGYGHLRNDARCAGVDDEYLPDYVESYSHAALIGANTEPDVSGDAPGEIPNAAAIFLHRHVYMSPGASTGATKATSGCVSLAPADLARVLVALRSDVLFVMGPTEWLLDTARPDTG
jgi:L,D-peptidoglycan transpeptidase YkuD (ErfK/YbiS/YcfS/YnhG family)